MQHPPLFQYATGTVGRVHPNWEATDVCLTTRSTCEQIFTQMLPNQPYSFLFHRRGTGLPNSDRNFTRQQRRNSASTSSLVDKHIQTVLLRPQFSPFPVPLTENTTFSRSDIFIARTISGVPMFVYMTVCMKEILVPPPLPLVTYLWYSFKKKNLSNAIRCYNFPCINFEFNKNISHIPHYAILYTNF